ncbi:SDR family oxidoreductase [Nocardia wallacei]|uniref:SDR family oxidoreductase n=1 Tax=Nocardia wallacei TaxID=480035 RepID=UPI00245551B3|nr:SDR family oxidoreductase [Nocardia wallacei]
MPMKVELVTGATGMLGSALVLELLSRTDSDIRCLVRAHDAASASAKLWNALAATADDLGLEAELQRRDARSRVQAVLGDIGVPGCGLSLSHERISRVWHCAATLRYESAFAAETHHANVTGTVNVMATARANEAELVHVSTAYVSGTRHGVQLEQLPDPHQRFNNTYERTKAAAEHIVAQSRSNWRIVRPSAVIASSRTRRTGHTSGLYDLAAKVQRFRRQYQRRYGAILEARPLRLCGDENCEINLVPLDYVASAIVRIGLDGPPHTIFHATNSSAPRAREVYDAVLTTAGLMPPRFVEEADDLDAVDRLLANAIAFHYPYIISDKSFDQAHTESVVGSGALAFHASVDVIHELLNPREPSYR